LGTAVVQGKDSNFSGTSAGTIARAAIELDIAQKDRRRGKSQVEMPAAWVGAEQLSTTGLWANSDEPQMNCVSMRQL